MTPDDDLTDELTEEELLEASEALANEVARMADETVALARKMKVKLDFEEPSVVQVDALLLRIAAEDLTPSGRELTAQRVGCYLLEVARRAHGGYFQWWEEREAPVLVIDSPDFHLGLFTWDKVRGRLRGSADDHIPFFYDGFAERVRKRAPGTDAVMV